MPDSASSSFFTGLDDSASANSSSASTSQPNSASLGADPFAPATAVTLSQPATAGTDNPPELPEIPIKVVQTTLPAESGSTTTEAVSLPSPSNHPTDANASVPTFQANNFTFPSVEEMLAQLDQSGVLLPELETQAVQNLDHSPLAALQPGQLNPEDTFFAAPAPSTISTLPLHQPKLATSDDEEITPGKILMGGGVMLAASILAVQVVQHLVQLLHFVMINYPQLQNEIMFHQASPEILNKYAVKAVWLFALSILSLVGCLFLFFNRESQRIKMFLIAAVVIIAINFGTEQFLVKPEFHFANPKGFQELRAVLMTPELNTDGFVPSPTPDIYTFSPQPSAQPDQGSDSILPPK